MDKRPTSKSISMAKSTSLSQITSQRQDKAQNIKHQEKQEGQHKCTTRQVCHVNIGVYKHKQVIFFSLMWDKSHDNEQTKNCAGYRFNFPTLQTLN